MPPRRLHDPYFDHKVYHYAAKFAPTGDVSALCYQRPRRINLARGQSWTLLARFVTCPRCRHALKVSPPEDFRPRLRTRQESDA